MSEFTMEHMQDMQRTLQDKYKAKWEPVCPRTGQNKVLWMICETGEVIDILKKKGYQQVMDDPDVRRDFVEELADVLMYYNDVMLCYGITPEELKQSYEAKFERNMTRW